MASPSQPSLQVSGANLVLLWFLTVYSQKIFTMETSSALPALVLTKTYAPENLSFPGVRTGVRQQGTIQNLDEDSEKVRKNQESHDSS
jgi:hypothetical protein